MAYLTTVIFLIAVGFFALRKIYLAEKFVTWFLVILFLWTSLNFINLLLNTNFKKKITKNLNKMQLFYSNMSGSKRKTLFIVAILFFILILGLNKNYYFGGDDTRLFYLYPYEYYKNLASKVVSDGSLSNLTNFLPATSMSAFVIFLWMLKYFFGPLNLQSMLYTANIILGIYFFYKFLGFILPEKRNFSVLRVISSLMYAFSIFNIYTLYNSRLIAVFLISVFPLTLYFFLKAIREETWIYIALVSIVLSVFSVVGLAIFWFAASILVTLPFLIFVIWDKRWLALKYLSLLGIFLFILNFHWLFYLPYTSLMGQSAAYAENSITSQNFLDTNAEGIRSTASVNSLFYPLMNTYHFQIQKNFNWPYLPIFQSWFLKVLPINSIFILSVIGAGMLINRNSQYFKVYIFSTLALLTALYFFTVDMGNTKLGNWGVEIFVWLSKNIPGFIIFRNMYDKFGHGLSVTFAVSVFLSLAIIFSKIRSKKVHNITQGIFLAVIVLNAKPFLLQEFNKLPVWTTTNTYQSLSQLNENYLDLIDFVKLQDFKGRYVLLPLNRGNNAIIQDDFKENHYYTGVSPFLILSGVNDFSGGLSFGPYDIEIPKAIEDKDYERVGNIFRLLNARFLIVNKNISYELQNSYLYSEGFYLNQQDEFYKELLGTKIRDFGSRYSLYNINPKYLSEKIYLTDNFEKIPESLGRLTYKKISSQEYQIRIPNFSGTKKIVFLDPYYKGWKLYLSGGKELKMDPVDKPFGYAMGWEIGANDFVSKTNDIELRLYFEPHKYYYPTLTVSILGYGILTILIIKYWVTKML